MKIQVRQSLYSSIAFGVVFIVLSLLIYFIYSKNTENAIYKNLEKTAHIAALFHLEEDELNSKEFAKVREQFEKISLGVYYQIYDKKEKLVWGNNDKEISQTVLNNIQVMKKLSFASDNNFYFGIFYEDNQGDFIIITKEPREFFHKQLSSLFWILLAALLVGLLTVIALSLWLAKTAYRPFSQIINQVKSIPPHNPSSLINVPNTKDELQELTETFNHLLEQISETFVVQNNFVNYVSHEFRTPLASMQGNLEVFSLKDRNPTEYQELCTKLISEIQQLSGVLNTLIMISDLSKGTDVKASFRIDELIWEIIAKLTERKQENKILVEIDILHEDEDLLRIHKDRTQVFMALFNIIENALKYAPGKPTLIGLKKYNGNLRLTIQDEGMGIPPEELEKISKPFFRANNTNSIQGSGIGLSIAIRILEKNGMDYRIISEEGKGTCFIIDSL